MVVWVYMLVLGTEPEWGLLFLAATIWSCIICDNLICVQKNVIINEAEVLTFNAQISTWIE